MHVNAATSLSFNHFSHIDMHEFEKERGERDLQETEAEAEALISTLIFTRERSGAVVLMLLTGRS